MIAPDTMPQQSDDELSSLSREELIARIRDSEQTAQHSRISEKQAQKRFEKANKRAEKLERKLEKRDNKVRELSEELDLTKSAVHDTVRVVMEHARAYSRYAPALDDYEHMELIELIRQMGEQVVRWIKENRALYSVSPYRTGPDVRGSMGGGDGDAEEMTEEAPSADTPADEMTATATASEPAAADESARPAEGDEKSEDTAAPGTAPSLQGDGKSEDAAASTTALSSQSEGGENPVQAAQASVKEVLKQTTSLKKNVSKLQRVAGTMGNALNGTKPDEGTGGKSVTAMKDIENRNSKRPGRPKPGKSHTGRVSKDRQPTKRTGPDKSIPLCPTCNGKMVPLSELKTLALSSMEVAKNVLEMVESTNAVYICQKDGTLVYSLREKDVIPVTPLRTVSVQTCIRISTGLFIGVPINRMMAAVQEALEFGNETFYSNWKSFVDIYISPLYEMIMKEVRESEVLLADGTPFTCLGAKEEEDDRQPKSYVLALSSPAGRRRPFAAYHFIRTRAGCHIEEFLDDSFRFEVLVTDGYPGYNRFEQQEGRKRQSCLIHFRRTIIHVLQPDKLAAELDKMDDKELLEFLKEQIRIGAEPYRLLQVFKGLSAIYAYEATCQGYSDDKLERRRKLREKHIKPLMDDIDIIMKELSQGRICQKGSGWQAVRSADIYAEPCVYYANQREQLRTFVDDARVPPDSNEVERAVLAITNIRDAIDWKRSVEHSEALCKLFTVYETGHRLGMVDWEIERYLLDFSRALYSHCVNRAVNQAYREGRSLKWKAIDAKWNLTEMSEGFDFERWNIYKYRRSR